MQLIASTIADRYQILNKIASGGMGEVFRGHDPTLMRDVAIKILHPHLAGDRGFVDRFRREARAVGSLSHPNIVGVYDWGTTNGTYFMVMEFVSGVTLRMLLAEKRRLEPSQVIEVTMPVLAALDHAHKHGIVHRDVKPENILISREGTIKVADFGLARAYADSSVSQTDGTVTGTVQYLAPEQIQGHPADPGTDLYAVGVVMFEMLTGRPPFAGETSLAIAYQHLTAEVPPPSFVVPSVPENLDRLVRWATEKDRSARPASAKTFAREVRRAAPSLPRAPMVIEVAAKVPLEEPEQEDRATTVTIPKLAPTAPRRRRRRGWLAVALLATLALLGGTAWAAWAYLVPHYTTVPNVAGMTLQTAETRLVGAGLRVTTGAGVYSQSVPVNQVVTTQPRPGVRVEKRDVIRLIPSLGRQLLPVPRVEGKREAAAVRILKKAGFQPSVKRAYDESVPNGRVIRQSAEAGNRLERDSPVTITVSRGPAPIEIPDVSGRPADAAKLTLETLGFKVRETEAFSTSVSRGEVIQTRPEAGRKALPHSQITIVVSRGPRVFAMPNVVGMTVVSAEQTLEGLGLHVRLVRLPGFTGDTVKLQRPDPDARVHEGDEVSIYA